MRDLHCLLGLVIFYVSNAIFEPWWLIVYFLISLSFFQVWVSCSSIRLVAALSGRSAEQEVFKDEAVEEEEEEKEEKEEKEEEEEEVYTDEEYQELEEAFQN